MTAPTWDLDAILPGQLTGDAYSQRVDSLKSELDALIVTSETLPELGEDLDGYSQLLQALYAITSRIGTLSLLAHCTTCADTQDRNAQREVAQTHGLWNRYQRAWVPLTDRIAHSTVSDYEALCARPELAPMKPALETARSKAVLLLPRAEQSLVTELNRDSVQAWSRHYDRISGRLKVTLSDGRVMSAGRASNLLSVPDAAVRQMAHAGLETAWGGVADDCAAALTHIVGTRLTLNTRRGVDELADTLHSSRMQRESLDAMLEAARQAGPLLSRYLDAKARLLGKEKLGFEDLSAPVSAGGGGMDWAAAQDFIMTHFHSYHPELAALAGRAFDERWVEAEDRDNKRQGAWCGSVSDQPGASRIFMTFGGTFRSTTTLAHELGHAFHNWALRDAHPSRRAVPSTLAETASVFAENIIRDAALAAATDRDSRLAMLDARLTAGVTFLMNLPFRFHLERDLYNLRAKGDLDPVELCERTVHWQRQCYQDSLSRWSPYFWASKLHFYIGARSFYNYSYTFGYLFSSLVYQRALAEGPSHHDRYVELLRRTGWQRAEPMVRELMGIDLTKVEDWMVGIEPLKADLEAFLKVADG